MLFFVFSFFFSYACAASYRYAFWIKYPDDNIGWNTPGDQLNTNYELHRALIDDSKSTTVYASRTNAIGEKGSTWWVMAKLDEAVYRQKYDGLDLVRRPENDSCTTLRMLMTYAGPSRRYLPAAREWFSAKLPPSSSTAVEDVATRRARRDDTDWTSQPDAPRQLKFISMPQSLDNNLDEENDYHYKESAGQGVRVYVIDSGINLEPSVSTIHIVLLSDCLMLSQEWSKGGRSGPDWIFVGPFATNQKVDIDDDGHGTCMADLTAGWVKGVAKSAGIIPVQVDDDSNAAFRLLT